MRTLALALTLAACADGSTRRSGSGPGDTGPDHDSGVDTSTDTATGTSGDTPGDTSGDTQGDTSAGTDDTSHDTGPTRAPPVASFHIVDRDDPYSFDAIRALSDAGLGPMINSQNRPDDLPAERWAQKINASWYADGAALAEAVHAALSAGEEAPATVLVDELNGDTVAVVADGAARLAAEHPEWRGRWGAWVVNGESVSYAALNPGLDALLDAGADLVIELYPTMSRYCAAASSTSGRDEWLAAFFRGGEGAFPQERLVWLMQRRAERGSISRVSIAFGVIDAYMDGTNPAFFLDRMFYVWMTRSKYRSLALPENGGVGAYKWDDPAMGNTSRDLAFAESFQHYVTEGRTDSREGPVDCD